jgi:serine protease Do
MTTGARLCVLGAALALSAGACREVPEGRGTSSGEGSAADVASLPPPSRTMYSSAPGSFVELVDNARPGVVGIRAASPVKSGPAAMFPGAPESTADVALGTGFLVEAQGVFVLTNEHVAAASPDLRVVLPGGAEVPARVVGRDVRLDLALLALEPPAGSPIVVARLHGLPLGDSDDLRVGEWLVVLGDAFGDEVTAATGVVSATGRTNDASLAAGRGVAYRTFLQTDARITRGNSGGPVIDSAGQVVGVAVATGDRLGEVSFAVPSNRVREVLGALRDTGEVAHSWLGALAIEVSAEQAATLGLPKASGALITEIKAASPAARAGLRPGDVILRWAGQTVDQRSLPWLVSSTPPGKEIELGIWRDRADTTLTIVTARMPE